MAIHLTGKLAQHRRGRILQEAASAIAGDELPQGRALALDFGESFQSANPSVQQRLIDWTRAPGHALLLMPPFIAESCTTPVNWTAERRGDPPRGSQGIAQILAPEVDYRLTGKLQTPAVTGATWSDLSMVVGTYRSHPAAGMFAATPLPLWSLTVLDAAQELRIWLDELAALAGEPRPDMKPKDTPLCADHYGFLIYLLSGNFDNVNDAMDGLHASSIFRISTAKARALLEDLQSRNLHDGLKPTQEAEQLVLQSPYGHYLSALREANPS